MFDKFFQETFLKEFTNIFEQHQEQWIDEEKLNAIHEYKEKLDNSRNDYKKNHHEFTYILVIIGLFFSTILIIPLYWNIKKFKELRENKRKLLANINHDQKNKLDYHQIIFNSVDWLNIFKSFNQIIPYKKKGAIPYALIEAIKANSLFDFNDENSNTLNTNWAVLNNNIVIHSVKQKHESFIKTYTGSETVSYYDEINNCESTAIVYAEYNHPAHAICNNINNYMYMTSCNDLEFKFDAKSNSLKSKFFNNRNNYSALENTKFEKEFNWKRNNETQFRMIFTPYCQETYLKAFNKNNIEAYTWQKDKDFIFNHYISDVEVGDINNFFEKYPFKFLRNVDTTIHEFKKEIFDFVIAFYYEIYLSFDYYWISTILQSEDHRDIINHIDCHQFEENDYYLYAHYILSEILKLKAIHSTDMDTFHSISLFNQNKSNNNIYNVQFDGLTYRIEKKVKYIPEYCIEAHETVSVPVFYDDYIPLKNKISINFAILNNKSYYYYFLGNQLQTNIDNENVLNIVNTLNEKSKKLRIINGIIAYEDVTFNQEEINYLIDYLNQI